MSDRSRSSFTVSRNLKNAKYRFIEAKIDKLTESSDTTPNSASTSTWLCITSNMKSTSHKTWQTSLIFGTSPNIKPEDKKWEDMAYYIPPPEKVGDTSPVPTTKLRPWFSVTASTRPAQHTAAKGFLAAHASFLSCRECCKNSSSSK